MKINLLRRPSIKYRRADLIRRINVIVLGVTIGLFVASIVVISVRYVYLQIKANSLKSSITKLQQTYFSRSSEVVDYARVGEVVTKLTEIQSKRFKYKDFLHSVYNLLPPGASLVSIDFSKEGILLESVRFETIESYEAFLARMHDESVIKGFLFKAVAQVSLVRDLLGKYQANLEIKI